MQFPQFLTDIFPAESISWKSGISPSNQAVINELLEYFFVKSPFLDYIGNLFPTFKGKTWKDFSIRHISIDRAREGSNDLSIIITYYDDDLHKVLYNENFMYVGKYVADRNHVEDYFMSLTGRRTVRQQAQFDEHQKIPGYMPRKELLEPKVIDQKDWPVNSARGDQVFAHVIAIWLDDITSSYLEDAMKRSEAEFEFALAGAIEKGFQPDAKFLDKMLDAKVPFELVCEASKASLEGLSFEQILRGCPKVINEKHHVPKRDDDCTHEEFDDWKAKFTAFHEQVRMLYFQYDRIIKPWWYDPLWALLNASLCDLKWENKQLTAKNREAKWKALKEYDNKNTLTRSEQILKDAEPRYDEYNVKDLTTTASYKAVKAALERKELVPTRELLFFAMNMDTYKRHHAATLDLLVSFDPKILRGAEDIDHMIDVVKPIDIAFEWIFKRFKPTRAQVERYIESCWDGCHPMHDRNILDFIQNCSEPYSNDDLAYLFVRFEIEPHERFYRDLKYTITQYHFDWLLRHKKHHRGLWSIIANDNISDIPSGRYDETQFESHTNVKTTADHLLTVLNFACGKNKFNARSIIIGFLFRVNPEIEVTRDHLKLAIRNNYPPVTVFFLMRRAKEPITIKELCEYVGFINREKPVDKPKICYDVEEYAKSKEQKFAEDEERENRSYTMPEKKPEYFLRVN